MEEVDAIVTILFQYEKLLDFCFKRDIIGHGDHECSTKVDDDTSNHDTSYGCVLLFQRPKLQRIIMVRMKRHRLPDIGILRYTNIDYDFFF